MIGSQGAAFPLPVAQLQSWERDCGVEPRLVFDSQPSPVDEAGVVSNDSATSYRPEDTVVVQAVPLLGIWMITASSSDHSKLQPRST